MDEKEKNAVMIAVIASCISIIVLMLFILSGLDVLVRIPLTLVLAGGIGVGAYYAAKSLT